MELDDDNIENSNNINIIQNNKIHDNIDNEKISQKGEDKSEITYEECVDIFKNIKDLIYDEIIEVLGKFL